MQGEKDEREVMRVNAKQCKTCIFNPRQQTITQARLQEITAYLIEGQNHQCHSTPYLCRGGRQLQAQVMCARGFIKEPTIESLNQAIIDRM